MTKSTTTQIFRMIQMITEATKSDDSIYFRFVTHDGYKNIYGEWMTPEQAWREVSKHDPYNTLRLERIIMSQTTPLSELNEGDLFTMRRHNGIKGILRLVEKRRGLYYIERVGSEGGAYLSKRTEVYPYKKSDRI